MNRKSSPAKLLILSLGLMCCSLKSDVNIFFSSEFQTMNSQFISETGEILDSNDVIIDLVRLPKIASHSDNEAGAQIVTKPLRTMVDDKGTIRSSFHITNTIEHKGELGVRVRALSNGEAFSGIYALGKEVDLSEGVYDIPPNNVMVLSGLDLVARKGAITEGGNYLLTDYLAESGPTVISIVYNGGSPLLRVVGIQGEVLKFEIQYCESLVNPDWKIMDESQFEIQDHGDGEFALKLMNLKGEQFFVRVAYY